MPFADLREQLAQSLSGRYTITRELGGGGMSRVFLAEEVRLARPVVIKVLAPELAAGISNDRFEREMRFAAKLQHPHIVTVLAAGDLDGLPYYTMPFIAGPSLRDRLADQRVPLADAIGILRDVARALAYAHEQGIVHRDIKPENVLLSQGMALVTDFGVARAMSAASTTELPTTLTRFGHAVGTPAYMSPEQAAADPSVDFRADLYALGVMAYELLAARHPFATRSTAQQLIVAHLTETPEPIARHVSGIPASLIALVGDCMAKDPAHRPSSAAVLVETLDAAYGAARSSVLRPTESARATVAVMPFVNMSTEPDNEYLSDGITEEIIGTLARLRSVRVAGRASSFALKGQKLDPRTIGDRLSVASVVEGTVRRVGNRIRVTAELIDTANGFQRWSDRFDREMSDVFALQDDIAQAISSALSTHLVTPEERREAPADAEAYRLYLMARHILRTQFSPETLTRAARLIDEALERDPNFAAAYAQRAVVNNNLGIFSMSPPHVAFPAAQEAAQRALQLDPKNVDAATIIAQLKYGYEGKYREAEDAFNRAYEFGSENTGLVVRFALFHAVCAASGGSHAYEAMRLARRGMELEPLSGWERFVAGTIYWLLRRNDEALAVLREAVDLSPNHTLTQMTLGGVLRDMGQWEEALPMLERAVVVTQRNTLALENLCVAMARYGDMERANALCDELVERSRTEWVAPYYFAHALAATGRREEAFEQINRAVETRDFWAVMMRLDPEVDVLRDDPRLEDAMRRLGIPG